MWTNIGTVYIKFVTKIMDIDKYIDHEPNHI